MKIECWMEHRQLLKRPRLSEEARREVLMRLKAHTVLAPLYWEVGNRGGLWANLHEYSRDSAKAVAMALVEVLWDVTTGEMQVRLWD